MTVHRELPVSTAHVKLGEDTFTCTFELWSLSWGNRIGFPLCDMVQLNKVNTDVKFSIALGDLNCWCTLVAFAWPHNSLLCHSLKLIVNLLYIVKWDGTWKPLQGWHYQCQSHNWLHSFSPTVNTMAACGL